VHHNFDDSEGEYENDPEQKGGRNFGIGGYKGRIIFLGDGTEVLTDSDDTEMFDNAEEDKDLESQVSKDSSKTDAKPADDKKTDADKPAAETPATEAKTDTPAKEDAKSA
jgi:protein phosphatase PTC2/3